jgi:hypothetical protein
MKFLPRIVFFVGVALLVITMHWPLIDGGGMGTFLLLFRIVRRSSFMQEIISILVLAASLAIILSKRYSPKDKHWAYTTVGTILGFWLNSN